MAHYAILDDNNVVTMVFTGHDENNGVDWETHYGEVHGKVCKRTSVNTHYGVHWSSVAGGTKPSEDQSKSFRYNFSKIGTVYDSDNDAFIMSEFDAGMTAAHREYGDYVYKPEIFSWVFVSNGTMPFASWVSHPITGIPQPPKDYPQDGKNYIWDESVVDFVEFIPPTE
mgnify:CR=1 FL=1|tara:strand:+ start:345 stop:851 length:507 start_codon:yes stop_codon:yes gene_type:complete